MKYKNIKTGAIIDSSSNIVGKAWQLIEDVKQEQEQVEQVEEVNSKEIEKEQVEDQEEQEYVEEEINLEEMTNKELEAFAKEHGVELNTDDKKNKSSRIAAIAKAFEED